MAGKKKLEVGPTGDTLRTNLRRMREARRLTFTELSTLLGNIGRPIPVLGLRRIEAAERRVDVDDLVALATVFRVNVSTLLLPPTIEGTTRITGVGSVESRQAWLWADGKEPLMRPDGDDGTAHVDFMRHARPPGLRSWSPAPE